MRLMLHAKSPPRSISKLESHYRRVIRGGQSQWTCWWGKCICKSVFGWKRRRPKFSEACVWFSISSEPRRLANMLAFFLLPLATTFIATSAGLEPLRAQTADRTESLSDRSLQRVPHDVTQRCKQPVYSNTWRTDVYIIVYLLCDLKFTSEMTKLLLNIRNTLVKYLKLCLLHFWLQRFLNKASLAFIVVSRNITCHRYRCGWLKLWHRRCDHMIFRSFHVWHKRADILSQNLSLCLIHFFYSAASWVANERQNIF